MEMDLLGTLCSHFTDWMFLGMVIGECSLSSQMLNF